MNGQSIHIPNQLSEPVYVNRYVIIPPQFADVAHETPSRLLGWGLEETGGTVQTILQEVDLIVFSDEDCRRRHDDMIYPSHICGGVPEGGRGQCSVSDVFRNNFFAL